MQGGHALGPPLVQVAFICASVLPLVGLDDLARGLVQPIGPVGQFGMGAAALFAGVGRELDAVNGKHLPPDQAQPVASEQHLGEQGLNVIAEFAHELGNMGVAGLAVAADGDELHVVQAGRFDAARGDQAPAL